MIDVSLSDIVCASGYDMPFLCHHSGADEVHGDDGT